MANFINVNLKVVVMDTDYYALQSVNGYLAWDRRTRVTFLTDNLDELWRHLERAPHAELPDVVILDADHLGGASGLRAAIERVRAKVAGVMTICLAQTVDPRLLEVSAESSAQGYLLKGEVRAQIAWAVVYMHVLNLDFTMTPGAARAVGASANPRLRNATVLPRRREYPELTGRVHQAMELCIIKGMPAQLAADEMGISLHTIRSYIKEGYRILEAYDETDYPLDMSPQERAFMRLTRFADDGVKT